MRGKKFNWCTDDNFPVGVDPWSSLQNKFPPSTAMQTEGRQPNDWIPAEYQNWVLHQLAKTSSWISGIQMANWWNANMSWVGSNDGNDPPASPWSAGGGATDVCFDESVGVFSAVDYTGRVLVSREVVSDPSGDPIKGGDGSAWDDSNGPNADLGWGGTTCARIESDNSGRRIITAEGSNDQIAIADFIGDTWVAVNTVASALVWYGVAHDRNADRWIIGGHGGIIEYSDPEIDPPDGGLNFSSATILNGPIGVVYAVAHNHETDGNSRFLAFDDLYCYWSDDGINWNATAQRAPHLLNSISPTEFYSTKPTMAAYSKISKRWYVLGIKRSISYSDDNGESWTKVSVPPIVDWYNSQPPLVDPEWRRYSSIKTDGAYGVMINCGRDITGPNKRAMMCCSMDGGLTWHRIEHPDMDNAAFGALCYGKDRFVLVGRDTSLCSMRLAE